MKLSVSYGRTINTGNYQSERVDASIEINFIDVPKEETQRKLGLLFEEVESFVNGKVTEIKERS